MNDILYDIREHFMSEIGDMFKKKKDNLTPDCVEVMKNMICAVKDIDTINAMKGESGYSQTGYSQRSYPNIMPMVGNSYGREQYGYSQYSQQGMSPVAQLEEMLRNEMDPRRKEAIRAAINAMQR